MSGCARVKIVWEKGIQRWAHGCTIHLHALRAQIIRSLQAGLRAYEQKPKRRVFQGWRLPMHCTVAYCKPFTRLPLRGQRRICPLMERTHRLPVSFHGRTVRENLKRYYFASIGTDEKTCKHDAGNRRSSCIHPDHKVMYRFPQECPYAQPY